MVGAFKEWEDNNDLESSNKHLDGSFIINGLCKQIVSQLQLLNNRSYVFVHEDYFKVECRLFACLRHGLQHRRSTFL